MPLWQHCHGEHLSRFYLHKIFYAIFLPLYTSNKPDYIGPLTVTASEGRRLIEFRMRVDGTYYTATAYPNVGTKKHDLDIDTFYKKEPERYSG